jgi:rod shape-determining protein MreB
MAFKSIFSLFSSDLAIDLGTANTLVYAKGRGIVVSEPSIVAINKVTNQVEAVGRDAKDMLGRTPGNIVAIRPMKDGVIANFEVTEKMLQHFIRKAHNGKTWVSPRVVIGIPSEITQVERRAVEDSAYRAKASEVYLVEEAMAAAIGAGLPITEPHGNMVVDIGGGTTDIAVISLDEAIIQYIKRKYNLLIGERTAEAIKIELGSAYPLDEPLSYEVRGRNLIEGIPKTITITDEEVREALADSISTIINAVRVALERTPPELSADIVERGIVLTGGGALLKNLDKRLSIETGLPVSLADDPLASVVLGTGKMLSDFDLLKRVKWENTMTSGM